MDKTSADKLTDAQLNIALSALESAACKDINTLVEMVEGTPGDDAKEWTQAFARAALNFEKHGPGGAVGIALLTRYRELLAEQQKRQQRAQGQP